MSEQTLVDDPAQRGGNASVNVSVWFSAAALVVTLHKQHSQSATIDLQSGMHHIVLTLDGPQLCQLFGSFGMAIAELHGAQIAVSEADMVKEVVRHARQERRVGT